MPTAIILAGPNGAGKTTFASGYFRDEPGPLLFINADEIGRELDNSLSGAARDLRRRFVRSRNLLERVYKPLMDDWQVFDSAEGRFDRADWKGR